MKVRVESDGTPMGTRVYEAESGDEIEGVRGVHIDLAVAESPEIELTLTDAELVVNGEWLNPDRENLRVAAETMALLLAQIHRGHDRMADSPDPAECPTEVCQRAAQVLSDLDEYRLEPLEVEDPADV